MFLQVAFDAVDCRSILSGISTAFQAGADAVELGTPVIANCGLKFISQVRALHPTQEIYADTKTIDFPEMEIEVAFSLGASTATAMMIMSDENLVRASASAKRHKRALAISTMGYPLELLARRVREVSQLGCDLIVAHGQGITLEMAFRDLVLRAQLISPIPGIRLICAGGIHADNVQNLLSFAPVGVIVGRAVTAAQNPRGEIERIRNRLSNDLA